MRTSTHIFATDLVDEGYDVALGRVKDLGHLDGVTYAGIYHHARDILPHDPVRKVIFHEGGHAFYRPGKDAYSGPIRPLVSRLVEDEDPLDRLVREADEAGLAVRVWTNYTHNTTLGQRHPEATIRNAFGDRYITGLCPAHPDVRRYIRDVSADLCRYPIAGLELETVCYLPFAHGYHHERSHYRYSPVAEFLLGLCFCDHCGAAVRREGVEPAGLERDVRDALAGILDGQPSPIDEAPLTETAVGALFSGRLAALLAARRHIVSTLATEVIGVVRDAGDVPVTFMDWSGGLHGYASGEAESEGAMSRAWQDGVDLDAVVAVCDGLLVLGYTNDRASYEADLARYRARVPDDTELSVAIRPMVPDCASPDEVLARTAIARDQGVAWIEYYHYGLMRLENLRWAGDAVAQTRPRP
jgi:hypothetical protein